MRRSIRRSTGRRSAGLALASLSFVASACGSHLTTRELVASDKLRGGAGVANATTGPSAVGTDSPGSVAAPGEARVVENGEQDGGRPTAALPRTAGGVIASPTVTAPAGGNGGATDIGVRGDSITLGTIETLTGPVPGLFRGAGIGVQACIAKTNAAGGLFGRQLKDQVVDDQFNENQARAAATQLVSSAFAFVGSASLYDGAMAAPMERAGMPDIGEALQDARRSSALNWSPQPNPPGWVTGGLSYLKEKFPAASQAVGLLGVDVAAEANDGLKAALAKLGFKVVYDQRYGATTTDFTAQVFRMKSSGVRMLAMTGDAPSYARVLQAANQQALKLDVFNPISNAYDVRFQQIAGNLTEGTIIYSASVAFAGEDAAAVPAVADFNTWMKRVEPDFTPEVFALYGWLSCEMFVQAATAIGPNLTRKALRDRLATVTRFDGRGLIAPGDPAGKKASNCYVLFRVTRGKWVRRDTPPDTFRCDGTYLYLRR